MRFNLSLLIFLFIAFNAGGQLSNGLIAHWDFNGNANDVSGNNINGTVTGATLVAGYNGIANTAYQFNGNGDQINIPYNSLMNITDSFSICALVKPTAFYSGPCQGNYILTRGTSLGPDFYNMGIFDQAYDLDCNIYSPNNEVFFSGDIGGAGVWYSGNTIINLNTWYCAVVTYDGDSARLYIDGIKRITLPWNKVYSPSTNGIAIAYYPPGGSQYPYWFTGSIDDMRLYSRALTASEALSYCDTAEMLPSNGVSTQSFNEPEVVIAPNPAHDHIEIHLPPNYSGTIQITNTLGQLVKEIYTNSELVNFDISSFPAGLYIIKTEYLGEKQYKKILKQ